MIIIISGQWTVSAHSDDAHCRHNSFCIFAIPGIMAGKAIKGRVVPITARITVMELLCDANRILEDYHQNVAFVIRPLHISTHCQCDEGLPKLSRGKCANKQVIDEQ